MNGLPESWPLRAPSSQDLRWLRVEDGSAVAACRNAALGLADRLRFPAARADQIAIAVTEAASNLHKHAREGAMWLAANRAAEPPGIDLATIDAGPGLADVSAALRDGHSTAGTLGIGLGAIKRLADACDLYSRPGHGTALAARFHYRDSGAPATPRWNGLIRPIDGETECGDSYAAVQVGDVITAVMCDGLGHGPLAASAAADTASAPAGRRPPCPGSRPGIRCSSPPCCSPRRASTATTPVSSY
jgi:anti-sigma regulatory factor (Ser/Thr protein kinase)